MPNKDKQSITETDAAHFRFTTKGPMETVNCYSCNQQFIKTSTIELINHFYEIEHKIQFSNCLYCSGPVYKYKNMSTQNDEIYHYCRLEMKKQKLKKIDQMMGLDR